MLQRIVYTSTLHPHITDDEVDALVAQAAAFNKSQNITGVLALEGKRVCQILEGPRDQLDALFRSILRDERHFGVTELVHVDIVQSSFETWGMVRRPMIDFVVMAFDLQA